MGNNAIVVYRRAADGTLTLAGAPVPTGGGGSGVQLDPTDSLGSQGGLMLDRKRKLLFAVNTETAAANAAHEWLFRKPTDVIDGNMPPSRGPSTVHSLPSSVDTGVWCTPVAGSQLSTVHGSPSYPDGMMGEARPTLPSTRSAPP